MAFDLTNKTVVITGANRGIGLEFTKQLIARQNKVIASCRNPAKATVHACAHTAADNLTTHPQALQKLGADHVLECDVSDQASIERLAAQVAGITQHVDLLINNAGVYGERSQQLPHISRQVMLDTFAINTLGPLFVTQALFNKGLLGGAKRSVVANVTSKVRIKGCGKLDTATCILTVFASWRLGSRWAPSMTTHPGARMPTGQAKLRSTSVCVCAYTCACLSSTHTHTTPSVNKSMSLDLEPHNITTALLHPGWVRTDMVNHSGLIDTDECVEGLLKVLARGHEVNGRWFDYAQREIKW